MPGLKGLLAQSLSANKPSEVASYVASYPSGTYFWTAPRAGRYRFAQWGGGGEGAGVGTDGGDGGAHAQTVRWVAAGQSVGLVVGECSRGSNGTTTILTLPDGTTVVTTGGARGAIASAPGVATGGDINVPGGSRSGTTGGPGGTSGLFLGGIGGLATGTKEGTSPGGGGADTSGSSIGTSGAAGLVIIALESLS